MMKLRKSPTKSCALAAAMILLISPAVYADDAFMYVAPEGAANANVSGTSGISIGKNVETTGNYGISIGIGESEENKTQAAGEYSTAIGTGTQASGNNSIAIGSEYELYPGADKTPTLANATRATAIGTGAQATQMNALAIGTNAKASGTSGSIAVGLNSIASGMASAAFGTSAKAEGTSSTAFGRNVEASGDNSIAIGFQAKAEGDSSIRIGHGVGYTSTPSQAVGDNSIAIGNQVNATKDSAIAIGYYASAEGENSIAIGGYRNGARATADNSMAIGSRSQSGGEKATALGYSAHANAVNSVAIGETAEVISNGADYSVAIGAQAKALTSNSIALGAYSTTAETQTEIYIPAGISDNNFIMNTSANEVGTVSIGDAYGLFGSETTRRLTSLAAGRDDTDAVNVAQLKGLGEAVANVIGGGVSFDTGSNSITVDGKTYGNLVEAIEDISGSGGSGSGVSPGKNIRVETNETTGQQTVHLQDEITLDSVTLNTAQDVQEGGKYAATTGHVHSLGSSVAELFGDNFAVGTDGSITGGGFSVNGKDNLNLQDALTEAASSGGSGDGSWFFQANDGAADEIKHNDTLKFADGSNLSIKHEADGSYSFNVSDNPEFISVKAESVTVGGKVNIGSSGIDMGQTKLSGLATGDISAGSSDAVTGGQLWDTYQRMGTMENNIYREMDDLREDVNVVGAHAAALSGLHPIQYNPYEPTTLSAAVGAYRDEYAVAVGVFHYTRENVMFNLGASLCSDGDVMGRAGVSFAVGKSSDKKPRLASTMGGLQKQVIDMQAKLDGLEEKNARNEEIIKQNAEIMAQNEKLIRELTKRLEAKN